ncbi:MAG: SIS domain-containing protein [Bacillota bacterium]|nr:SIS domain-containing protein [Bacillota bacterium]
MRFYDHIRNMLEQLEQQETETITSAAELMAEAIEKKKCIWAFGTTHANLVAKDMVYRTGGLAVINPISAPGMDLDVMPFTLSSQMERYERYGADLIRYRGVGEGDVVILHSVSGRNTVMIDAALAANELGAHVIVITNLAFSEHSESRHPSGKLLYELGEVVIDNCGEPGDACLSFPELPAKVAPTSTVMGGIIASALIEKTVELLIERGVHVPVLMSANMPGGDEYNDRMFEAYKDQIHYM